MLLDKGLFELIVSHRGVTIHSFFGLPCMPLVDTPLPISNAVIERLRACKRLIVDEISMVRSDIFTEMDRRMRLAKGNDKPFGGCQIVACGDFHQLPPVVENQLLVETLLGNYRGIFAFETETWQQTAFTPIVLKQQMRQAEDPVFLWILNAIRDNHPEIIQAINTLNTQVKSREDGIPALCCRREEACAINQARLEALPGEEFRFRAQTHYNYHISPELDTIGNEFHDLT